MKKYVLGMVIIFIISILTCSCVRASSVNVKLNNNEPSILKITVSSSNGEKIDGGLLNLILGDGVKLVDVNGAPDIEITDGYEVSGNLKNNRILFNQSGTDTKSIIEIKVKVILDESKSTGIKLNTKDGKYQILINLKNTSISEENSILQVGDTIEDSNSSEVQKEDESGKEQDLNLDTKIDMTVVDSGKLTTKNGSSFGDKNIIVIVIVFIIIELILISKWRKLKGVIKK